MVATSIVPEPAAERRRTKELLGFRSDPVRYLPLGSDLAWLEELTGGMAEGGIILLCGGPGSGKSRLATQIGLSAATRGVRSLTVLREEQPDRLLKRVQAITSQWHADEVTGAVHLMEVTDEVHRLSDLPYVFNPRARPRDGKPPIGLLIIDSVQGDGLGAGAFREYDAFYSFCRTVKAAGITVLALAHVNKANQIAGPKGLEHFVDCVLRLERAGVGRLLSAPKNRFYREQQIGLALDTDETTGALSPSPHCEPMTGVARTFIGGEPGEAEVQVRLSLPLPGEKPKVYAPNLPTRRIEQLVRSISAARGLDLADLNLNISSLVPGDAGFRSWLGLPLAISLASSLLRRRVPPANVYLGEIDLNRSIRPLSRGLIEVLAALADSEPFPPSTRVFLPAQSAAQLDGFPSELVPCATFDAALALTWPDIT